MKKFVFPYKAIEELPSEVATHLLLLIARNTERKLNENAGKSYRDYDVDGRFIAEVLSAMEVEVAEDEENTDSGHSPEYS